MSYRLVIEREPGLAARFYDTLFTRHPEVTRLFRRNARPEQHRMLTEALASVVAHLDDPPWLEARLGDLGRRHVYYGVDPEMYDWMIDALLITLRDVCRTDWTDHHEQAWRTALLEVTSCMKAGARTGPMARRNLVGSPTEPERVVAAGPHGKRS